MQINRNFLNVQDSYLFSTIGKKVAAFQAAHPEAALIRLGIGDVTRPLAPVVVAAMRAAAAEMGEAASFRGYAPDQGYAFLREAIQARYAALGVTLEPDEIFVSDGIKSDLGNILDIFGGDNTVLVPDPVYPVYVDTNIMDGRRIVYANAGEENGFLPLPDASVRADIVYICSPNNPTGAVYNKEQLRAWVDYTRDCGGVLLFDGAYEAFIRDPALPHSIFEIPGAADCAIEFCSFSKTAGFTGTRCGYTVIPRALERDGASLLKLWARRQATKFNGVPYIIQRAAAAVLTPEGLAQTRENIAYYAENAAIIARAMRELGIYYIGGENAPYIWLRCPDGMGSWDFFDRLLEEAHVVGTPGEGFGANGKGFFRLTAFGNRENTVEAVRRIRELLA